MRFAFETTRYAKSVLVPGRSPDELCISESTVALPVLVLTHNSKWPTTKTLPKRYIAL